MGKGALMRCGLILLSVLALAACQDYTPREKAAQYDPASGKLIPPYPCPDWSKGTVVNYGNTNHSNFGCATAGNLAAQLDQPSDLYSGHGTPGPDTEITAHKIELFRADKIPVELIPQQSTTGQ